MATLATRAKRNVKGAQKLVPLADRTLIREIKLGEQLYRYLCDLINSEKVQHGAQLPTEKQLCENFHMSRPTVREALARLRMEGLIVSRRGSGSYVNRAHRQPNSRLDSTPSSTAPEGQDTPSVHLLRHFELRMAIECDAAYYAAMRRQPKHLATMSAAITEMEAALRIKSLDHDAHFRFHLSIAEAAANQYFIDALLSLRQYLEVSMNLFRELWLLNPGQQVSPGAHNHARIFRAIERSEPGKAYRAMFLHIDEARRELFGNLADPWPGLRDSEL